MSISSTPDLHLPPTDRLFFGVFPDPESAEQIARFASAINDRYALRGIPVSAELLVVTLAVVGRYRGLSEREITAASELAARVVHPTFEIAFSLMERFGGGAFVLHGGTSQEALRSLCTTLECTLTVNTPRIQERLHTPHMTVLKKTKGGLSPRRRIAPIPWSASEIVLVHRVLGRPELHKLARWALT